MSKRISLFLFLLLCLSACTKNTVVHGPGLSGGTFSTAGQTRKGTAFALRYSNANNQTSSTPIQMRISGPTGWNNNQTLEITYPANSQGYWLTSDAEAVSGTYTLSAGDSNASTTIDATSSIPAVQNAKITGLDTSGVSASWENGNEVVLKVFDSTIGQYLPNPYPYFGNSYVSTTINDLHQNELHIFNRSFNADYGYVNPGNFHVSRVILPLSFLPEIKRLSHDAGPNTGNVRITIYGSNFRNDSKVKFGAITSSSTAVESPAKITAIVPAQSVGVVDVVVTTALGSSSASEFTKFKYFEMQTLDIRAVSRISLGATSDNSIWHLPTEAGAIGLTSASNSVTTFDVPKEFAGSSSLGSIPMAVDRANNAWFPNAVYSNGTYLLRLVRVTPSGEFSAVLLPDIFTSTITGLELGDDNNLWFTLQGSTKVYRIGQVGGGNLQSFSTPNNEVPIGLKRGLGNALWFTSNTGNATKIGKVLLDGSIQTFFIDGFTPEATALTVGPQNLMWMSSGQGWIKITSDGTISRVPWTTLFQFGSFSNPGSSKTAFDGSNFWAGSSEYGGSLGVWRISPTGEFGRWAVFTPDLNNSSPSPFTFVISDPAVVNGKVYVAQNGKLHIITP